VGRDSADSALIWVDLRRILFLRVRLDTWNHVDAKKEFSVFCHSSARHIESNCYPNGFEIRDAGDSKAARRQSVSLIDGGL
jgi:hypothetical protein